MIENWEWGRFFLNIQYFVKKMFQNLGDGFLEYFHCLERTSQDSFFSANRNKGIKVVVTCSYVKNNLGHSNCTFDF